MKERERLEWPEFSQKPAFKVASRSGAASVALYRGPISEKIRTVGIVSVWSNGTNTARIIDLVAPGFDFNTAQQQLAYVGGPDDKPAENIGNLRNAQYYKALIEKIGYSVERNRMGTNKEITVVTSPTVTAANEFAESVFGDDRVKLEPYPGRYTALEFLTAFVERDSILVADATDGENLVWQLHDDAALQKLAWLGVDNDLRDKLKERIAMYLARYKNELAFSAVLDKRAVHTEPSLPILKYIMGNMHDFGDGLAEVLIEGVGENDAHGAMYYLNAPPNRVMHPGVPKDFALSGDTSRWLGDADRIQDRFEEALAFATTKDLNI